MQMIDSGDPSGTGVSRPSVADMVQTLREEIINGTFTGGEILAERALAQRFDQPSRPPIREVLRQLKAEGLVEQEPRRRATVKPLRRRDVANLSEAHQLFDSLAIAQAAGERDHDDLAEIGECIEACVNHEKAADYQALREEALRLRETVYRATRNPILVEVHDFLRPRIRRLFSLSITDVTGGTLVSFNELFDSLQAGDAERARACFDRCCEHWRSLWIEQTLTRWGTGRTDLLPAAPARSRGTRDTPDLTDPYEPEHLSVLHELRHQIVTGSRAPGSTLSERRISAEFGISRYPALEAIGGLIAEGLAWPAGDRTPARVRGIRKGEARHLIDVCVALDSVAARFASERATLEQLDKMGHLIDEIEAEERRLEGGDDVYLSELVNAWRAQLHAFSGNDVLTDVNRLLSGRLQMLMIANPVPVRQAGAHRQIYEAIEAREPRLAENVFNRVVTPASRDALAATPEAQRR